MRPGITAVIVGLLLLILGASVLQFVFGVGH